MRQIGGDLRMDAIYNDVMREARAAAAVKVALSHFPDVNPARACWEALRLMMVEKGCTPVPDVVVEDVVAGAANDTLADGF